MKYGRNIEETPAPSIIIRIPNDPNMQLKQHKSCKRKAQLYMARSDEIYDLQLLKNEMSCGDKGKTCNMIRMN